MYISVIGFFLRLLYYTFELSRASGMFYLSFYHLINLRFLVSKIKNLFNRMPIIYRFF